MVNPEFDGAQQSTTDATASETSDPSTSVGSLPTTGASTLDETIGASTDETTGASETLTTVGPDDTSTTNPSTTSVTDPSTSGETSTSDTGPTTGGMSNCPLGDTGWVSPTLEAAAVGDGFEDNPQGAFADGGGFASNIDSPGDSHLYHGFALAIPEGCAVRGLEVRADWWTSDDVAGSQLRAALSTDGGTTWSTPRTDLQLTLVEHTVEFGSPVSRWSMDWPGVDLEADSVRVRLETQVNGVAPTSDTFVDWVAVRVHYGDPIIDTGLFAPTSEAPRPTGDGDGFEVTPTGAFVQGGDVAQDVDSGTDSSTDCASLVRDGHQFYDFGLGIPAGSTVHGLRVRADTWVESVAQNPRMCVRMSWDAGAQWTVAEELNLSDTPQTFLVGADDFTWGRVWDAADLSDENFRLEVSTLANSTARDFFLDYVAIDVAYDEP